MFGGISFPAGFNPNYDYKSAHLVWLKDHKNFETNTYKVNKWSCEMHLTSSQMYIEILEELYSRDKYPQYCAYTDMMKDIKHYNDTKMVIADMVKNLNQQSENDYWFVTISFNHQTYTPVRMMKYVYSLMSKDFIKAFKGKFEIYRSNGLHPHIHIKLQTDLPKSKIIERIFNAKSGKDLILHKNFIDVKVFELRHDGYLNGNKTQEKMEYVLLDNTYRNEHNIPEFFKKNL